VIVTDRLGELPDLGPADLVDLGTRVRVTHERRIQGHV